MVIKNIKIIEWEMLDISILNNIIQEYNPKGFLNSQEIIFEKCNHKFMLIIFLSKKGLEIEVLNKENCEDCSNGIKNYLEDFKKEFQKEQEK